MSRKRETAIQARFGDVLFDRIEEWRRTQRRIPPLADTVRKLVERGLDAEASKRNRSSWEQSPPTNALGGDVKAPRGNFAGGN
jgi:hypothetical protein